MAVDVTPGGPNASGFRAGAPHPLFSTPMVGSSTSFPYDVAQDGKRFLMVVPAAGATSAPATVVLNWELG